MAQKVCGRSEKQLRRAGFRSVACLVGRRSATHSPRMRFHRAAALPAVAARCQCLIGGRNVKPILVFRVPRPATRSLYGSPAPRFHRQWHGRRRRWSGARAWRIGKRRGKFRACSRGPRVRRLCRTRVGRRQAPGAYGSGSLSIDFGIMALHLARGCVFFIGAAACHPGALGRDELLSLVVVPAPHVPGRPNLAFTGQAGDILVRLRERLGSRSCSA